MVMDRIDVTTLPTGTIKGREIRQFRVTVTAGPATGTTWTRPAERCVIGSHPSSDLVIDDPTVSRFHCELECAGPAVRVRDLGSRNGTFVGRVRVVDATIPDATALTIGGTALMIEADTGLVELPTSARTQFGSLIGTSPRMREVFSQLERVAASDATVLVQGETGTGKEGVASAIHEASARANQPLIVIDCSAIPSNLLESELFGHEAGAFTGATERRIGAFERASGGTVFLDEIGELPGELQPKLLRVLEAREIRRVGGASPIKCDLRVIAATHRDLHTEVNRGVFRADLFFRLAVVEIRLPPLRDRPQDVELLVPHLLRQIGASEDLIAELTAARFLDAIAAAPWPGNVRELRNHLERCVVFRERLLPNTPELPRTAPVEVGAEVPYAVARQQAIDHFEHAYVEALLARHRGNVTSAARTAGVNRVYLHRLLRRHNLR